MLFISEQRMLTTSSLQNSRVLVHMLWLSMQLEYVAEQLVRTFNRFYAVNSTAESLFELADSFSRTNWQLSNWQ